MEQPPNQPIYWDKHRIPVNITIFFSLAVAGFGLFTMVTQGGDPLLLIAGLAVGAYSWFTNPRQYWIYPDALVIVYGTPRVRNIPFTNISHLEVRTLNTPDKLRAHFYKGRRAVLLVRDPDAFHEKLQKALDDYRSSHPELFLTDGDASYTPE